jgi:hypothetical protein
MALIYADRVQEASSTTGTGALTLSGAIAGFRTFGAVCANTDTAYYAAWGVDASGVPTGEWETGLGTWGTGGVLTRTTVSASSNANAAVNFGAGVKRVALSDPAASRVMFPSGMVVGKARGTGIKVDPASPTTTWRDLTGNTIPKAGGVNAPTLAASRGGRTQSYFYLVGDRGDDWYHIPHDWAGTDLFLHVHWGHDGTAISGTFTVTCYLTYASRGSTYQAEITTTITAGSLSLANTPQFAQRVDEIQLTAAAPTAAQFDTDNIEVDGVIKLHYEVTTAPTITGGTTNRPYIDYLDIHYESTNVGTKNKAADFYA